MAVGGWKRLLGLGFRPAWVFKGVREGRGRTLGSGTLPADGLHAAASACRRSEVAGEGNFLVLRFLNSIFC